MTAEGVIPNLALTVQGQEIIVPVFLLPVIILVSHIRPTCGKQLIQ
jgi:hypothetical protein